MKVKPIEIIALVLTAAVVVVVFVALQPAKKDDKTAGGAETPTQPAPDGQGPPGQGGGGATRPAPPRDTSEITRYLNSAKSAIAVDDWDAAATDLGNILTIDATHGEALKLRETVDQVRANAVKSCGSSEMSNALRAIDAACKNAETCKYTENNPAAQEHVVALMRATKDLPHAWILFESGSATLSNSDIESLRGVEISLGSLAEKERYRIYAFGSASPDGAVDSNIALAGKRTNQAVARLRDLLAENALLKDRVRVSGTNLGPLTPSSDLMDSLCSSFKLCRSREVQRHVADLRMAWIFAYPERCIELAIGAH